MTPKNGGGVSVTADIPLRFLAEKSGNPILPDSGGLLRPLQLAAEATLKHVGSNDHSLQVEVECEIPVAAGLGSSASTTVAIISAVARSRGVELSKKNIFELAFVPENFLHGKPSGVDQATCIYGGMIQFSRPSSVKTLRPKRNPVLLVCDTGIHHATRTLVGGVVQKSKKEKKNFRTPGAKLTGAGGGGCVIILSPSIAARDRIARVLRREGGTPYKISMDTGGVESQPA